MYRAPLYRGQILSKTMNDAPVRYLEGFIRLRQTAFRPVERLCMDLRDAVDFELMLSFKYRDGLPNLMAK